MIKKRTYIKIIALFVAVGCSNLFFSQSGEIHTRHVGKNFMIDTNTNVNLVIIGNFIDTVVTGVVNNTPIKNNGFIKLDGDLKNYGYQNFFGATPDTGRLEIFGLAHSILGTSQINFCNLEVNLTPGLNLSILKKVQINADLDMMSGNVFLDSDRLVMNYLSEVPALSGIKNETNTNRIYGPNHPVVVQNVPWNFEAIYSFAELKGIGIDFETLDVNSTSANIYRYNVSQQCGPIAGSVERTYRFDNITNPVKLKNINARFHNPLERLMYTDADSMHIYVNHTAIPEWRDIGGDGSVMGTVSNSNDPNLVDILNNSAYTIAKDSCDILPEVYVHQILNVSDTLFDVSEALLCDPSNPNETLLADGSAGDYYWITPSNNQVSGLQMAEFPVTATGSYTLVCVDARGCVNKKEFELSAAPQADPDFDVPMESCDQVSVSFTPTGTVATSSYFWDFGDGNTLTTTPSPSAATNHVYSTFGNYNVSLTVTTVDGCISEETTPIVVHPIPVADFVPGTACHNSPVNFTNQTTISGSNATDLNWDFTSDGTVDLTTNQFPSGGDAQFTYPAAGTYNVTLTASSNNCVSAPITFPVTVNPLPNPDFTTLSACEGQAVDFVNSTDTVGFSPTTFLWNFNTALGLGSPTSTFENPNYTYPSSGNYSVSLQATNMFGCVNTDTIPVTVDENPISVFTLNDTCENTEAVFADMSTAGSSSISDWSWDFGDGNTSTTQNGSNIYLSNGIYTATLTVTTPQNCTSTSTQSITIFDGPSVGFSVLPACQDVPVNIWNTTTNAVSYGWTIPSLAYTSANNNEIQTFGTAGYHDIELTATSVNGCENTLLDSVLVNSLPVDNFGDTTKTCGTSLIIDANELSSNSGSSFSWNTGASSSDINVTIAGLYVANITTSDGCVLSDSTYVLLNVPVSPNLGNDGAQCDSALLNAGSYGSGTSYSWTESTPIVASSAQEISVFVDGEYIVEVTDQNGCVGKDTINVTIVPSTPVSLGAPLQDTCEGIVYALESNIIGTAYLWNDGSTGPSLDVTSSGYYWIEVTSGGCSSRDTVEVAFVAVPTFSLGPSTQSCDSLVLNAFAGSGVSYQWSSQNGNLGFSETVYTSGTYWAEVTLDSTECAVIDSIDVIIHDSPVLNMPQDTAICSYQTLVIDPGNPGGVNFLWNTGATTPTITVASTGNYAVTLADQSTGCLSNASVNVNSLPLFTIDLGNDVYYCEGSTVELSSDNTPPNSTYSWYNSTSNLVSTETYFVQDTGTYYLNIEDEYGCIATDSIEVLPSSLELFSVFLFDSDIEHADTVQFVNLSYPQPYTSSWNFGNNTPIDTASMPSHKFYVPFGADSVTYEVSLTINNGVCNSTKKKDLTVRAAAKVLENPPLNPELYTSILEALVYPNPNNGNFTLKLRLENTSAIQVDVFNLMGQLIESDSFVAKEVNKQYELNKILPGMYLVRVKAGRDQKTVKFIKIYK
ncbi:PKD domain-containing protein [Flavobacteriales bacterium]|nr:PKD domain-containing protein [Flavobacteriales bacterium]